MSEKERWHNVVRKLEVAIMDAIDSMTEDEQAIVSVEADHFAEFIKEYLEGLF